ncbi:MAG: hypothetical protein JRH07_07245 [Deltaproteobacteria bacterium]|nr:hypothetical protein [Deltaproteobacteria bacterium]MBW2121625.1 hypothetical protein [Deltaproteobacteria bacterium]
METRRIVDHLEELAEKLGIEVIHESLAGEDFPVRSGICKVKGRYRILLDRSETAEDKMRVLARALACFNTEGVYLLPQIRGILEQVRRSQ